MFDCGTEDASCRVFRRESGQGLIIGMMSLDRYHRQVLLAGIGEQGQARIAGAHVLLIGAGALGCTAADLLVRAGVGTLTIIDRDVVELTNLQRQTLYDERDVAEGIPKAFAAQRRLRSVNSGVRIRAAAIDFTPACARPVAAGEALGDEGPAAPVDLIIDGTDNFETRYLMNDVAVSRRTPYLYGGAVGTRGMQITIPAGGVPCLRCIFPEPPAPGAAATCDTAGVLAPAPVIIASCQVTDAIRLLVGQPVAPSLLDFDLWHAQRRRIDASAMADPDCPCCVHQRFEFLDGHRSGSAEALCGRNSVQVSPRSTVRIDLDLMASRLHPHGRFERARFVVRGEFAAEIDGSGTPVGLTLFSDGRAIIHGLSDAARARSIYARYIGA